MIDRVICGDCVSVMGEIPDESIDLTVTSPPYDNLREYNGYSFDFESVAKELYRVTKDGGVVVWVVGDSTVDGSESGTSFKQALYFKEIGFRLHDTMIYAKNNNPLPEKNRYFQSFEYMFVFSKGKPKTFNPIKDRKNINAGLVKSKSSIRNKDGSTSITKTSVVQDFGARKNIWTIDCGYMKSTKNKESYKHPAIFPDKLAEDHILTWSNVGDTVLDPFAGSGTTLRMAKNNNRRYIGIEISPEYVEIISNSL